MEGCEGKGDAFSTEDAVPKKRCGGMKERISWPVGNLVWPKHKVLVKGWYKMGHDK